MTVFDLSGASIGALIAENLQLHHRVSQLERRVEMLSGYAAPEAARTVRPKTPPRRFRSIPAAEERARL